MEPRGSWKGENSMGPPRTISNRPSAERTATLSAKPTPAVGGYGVVKRAAPKTEKPTFDCCLSLCSSSMEFRKRKCFSLELKAKIFEEEDKKVKTKAQN
ncbi:hypothetical protein PoB_006251800 [Plakobranchus ocellatus]|uniref:Uncharacterized protein n=1 Tax=Plakobranchus ocellatus TaxID=259542 RepID=A0AAV4CVU0_9GAST|nr:hypothetical protein PoB_006251800 [Plakobranchus ocellatus]